MLTINPNEITQLTL